MLSNGVSLDGLSFDVISQLEKPTPTKDRDISPRSPPASQLNKTAYVAFLSHSSMFFIILSQKSQGFEKIKYEKDKQ